MINIFTGRTIQNDALALLRSYGEPIRLQYYTRSNTSGTSVYDDDISFSKSGTDVWTVGMIFPIANAKKGSSEALLLEQGKLQADDMAVYLPGTISASGAAVKIGFGSPVDDVRFIIHPGAEYYESVSYVKGYVKMFTRHLLTGSFQNEV